MKAKNIEELHRGKPAKPWLPGQEDQAITRLARSPIHQAMVSDVAFTADDHNSISWAAGSIKFSNGVSYTIAAGTLELTATHYIYHVRGDNALWSSTTFSDAIGYDKTLVAVATAVASGGKAKIFVLFGGIVGDWAETEPRGLILHAPGVRFSGGNIQFDVDISSSRSFWIDGTKLQYETTTGGIRLILV